MLWWVECRCGIHQELCEPVHECTALAAAFVHHASPGKEEHLYVMVVECRCGIHQERCEPVHKCTALSAAFVHHATPGEEEHLYVVVGGM
jgi:hypothetical protein